MKRYHVAYAHNRGFGSCVASCKDPIRTPEDVEIIRIAAQKNDPNLEGVIIINFIELDDADAD